MKRLRYYFSAAWAYLIVVVLMKIIECVGADALEGLSTSDLLIRALTYNLVIVSWEIFVGMLLSLLIGKFSPRLEKILCIIYFSLLLLAEVALSLYASHNGFLLSSELWLRPLSETYVAVRAAIGLCIPLMLLVFLPAAICLFSFIFRNYLHHYLWVVLPLVCLFVLLSICFHLDHLVDWNGHRYIVNKTSFLAVSTYQYLRDCKEAAVVESDGNKLPIDGKMLHEFLQYHSDWEVEDSCYPLERRMPIEDVLSPFFCESKKKPDVILFVVESFGDEYLTNGYMPFLNTLAQQGLYWKNCLSTTSRSFGALPAITASAGGPKGFQFGRMPDCNSLMAIFRKNHYQTNAFYAGFFTFDCIAEYLNAQHVDYLSPFWSEWKNSDQKAEGNYWGYHDAVMLDKTIAELRTRKEKPQFSVITTLSMHEGLALKNKKMQQKYLKQARACDASAFSADITSIGRLAVACYTDDALCSFFLKYSQLPRFKNTIFIITGDHASGLRKGEVLNMNYHVPLIIWSPLLKRCKTFPSLVTHWDIAPSLQQLLANKYHLKVPSTIHAWGDGLDTTATFTARKDMLMVNYNREMREMISGKYYYQAANIHQAEQLFTIGSALELTPCSDKQALQQCRRKLEVYRYVFSYAYYNNRTTAHPLFQHGTYKPIITYCKGKDLLYTSPALPPSKIGSVNVPLFQERSLPYVEGYTRVRLTLTADVNIIDSLWQDNYPNIVVKYINENDVWSGEGLSKYLQAEVLRKDSTYRLEMVKEYPLSLKRSNMLSIAICSTGNDDYWSKEKKLLIRNIALKVEYAP